MRLILVAMIIALIVMTSACSKLFYTRSETTPPQNGAISDISETEPLAEKDITDSGTKSKKRSWLLTSQEGVEDRVQFLTNIDDPSGKSYVRVDDMVDAMQTKEERIKYKEYWLNVGRISIDGTRMAVFRENYDLGKVVVQVYNLNLGKKELEFELSPAATNFVISPDLETYLYEVDEDIYKYDAVGEQTVKITEGKQGHDLSSLQNGIFSTDKTKFLFLDDEPGIVVLNLSGEQENKRLLPDSNVTGLMKWNSKNEIYYTQSKKTDFYDRDIYKVSLNSEKTEWISKGFDSSLLSEDESKLVFLNDKAAEFLKDINSGKIEDISSIVQNEGTRAVPYQWIDTTVDYMKYSNIVEVKRLSASSTLVDQVYPNVDTKNLTDDNNLTAWCEGVPGDGEGETITIDLGDTQKVRGLEVINGYNDSMQAFEENNQVEKMRLEFSDGSTIELENFDIRTIFDEPVETSFIKITILEVQLGTKYQNTCVSELKVL